MISSGLFILPGIAHAHAGPAVIFSYFFAGLIALTGLFSEAELVSAMPKSGGTYFFVTRSMGPAAGTINGLIIWFSLTAKSAFALVGMAAFTELLVPVDIKVIGIALALVFVGVNLIGVKEAGKLQVVFVAGLLALLVFYVVSAAPKVEFSHLSPFAPFGLYGVFSTSGMVFVSYGGLLNVTSVAEEVKDPGRTIPLGMILSLVTAVTIYTVAVFVTTGVLPHDTLNHSLKPISDGAFAVIGHWGMVLLSLAAVFAFVSTANAGIMSASRYPLAMARDKFIPGGFSLLSKKFNVPYVSVLATGVVVILLLLFKLEILVKLASTILLISFIFSCLSVIIMRESRVQNYRPTFKSPLYPWVQLVGIAGFLLLIFEMGIAAFAASAAMVGIGFTLYWFYGRGGISRRSRTSEFALLSLLHRITASEFAGRTLETELRDIIRERDEIALDRFDRVVENAMILDLGRRMSLDEFFAVAADHLSKHLACCECDDIVGLLTNREQETSTVIAEGVAIPHIIVEGENQFDILLVRNRHGIIFEEGKEPVDTVFILAGSRDERNFHLRALSAIAQIVSDEGFHDRWLAAQSKEALRDTILLGKRRR
jgi:amino acid transporter